MSTCASAVSEGEDESGHGLGGEAGEWWRRPEVITDLDGGRGFFSREMGWEERWVW